MKKLLIALILLTGCGPSRDKMMGKRILVGKDTLTIVNYAVFQPEYTLSNGLVVVSSFVDSNLIK